MEQASTGEGGRRCARHGLALGPDGRCVLCRRENGGRGGGGKSSLVIVAASLVVLTGAAVAYFTLGREPGPVTDRAPVAVSAKAEAAPVSPSEPAPRPVARRRGESSSSDWRKEPLDGERKARRKPAALPRPRPAPRPAPKAVAPPPKPKGPSQAELLAAMRKVPIQLYYTTWCPACKRARAWLRTNRLNVREYDIERNAAAKAALNRLTSRRTIPVMRVAGKTIFGLRRQVVWRLLEIKARADLRRGA